MTSSDNVLGETLSWLMKRAKLKNPDVATATHVDPTTVSKWRSGVNKPDDAKLQLIVSLMRSRGLETSILELRYGPQGAHNGGGAVSEGQKTKAAIYGRYGRVPLDGELAFETPTAKQRALHWLEGFLLEIAEAGADQDFIDSSRRLLLNAANYMHGFGAPAGTREEMDDDQKLRHMQALSVGVREALKYRLKQLKGIRK